MLQSVQFEILFALFVSFSDYEMTMNTCKGDMLYEEAWENLQAAQEQFEIAKRLRRTSEHGAGRYANGPKLNDGQRLRRHAEY